MTTPRWDPAEAMDETTEPEGMGESGISYLFQHDSGSLLVEALLECPPGRGFNKSELAAAAGVTRQTVARYVDRLLGAEIIEEIPDTAPPRYRVAESTVMADLQGLDEAIRATVDDLESRE